MSVPLNKLTCKSSSKGDCDTPSHVCCVEQQGNKAFDILKTNLPEKCRTSKGKGLCKSASKCETVSVGNKKQGSCSKRSEVCCYYERPQGVTDRQVTQALSKTNVSSHLKNPDLLHFSLDWTVTKNQLLNTKCQLKFLLSFQFKKR